MWWVTSRWWQNRPALSPKPILPNKILLQNTYNYGRLILPGKPSPLSRTSCINTPYCSTYHLVFVRRVFCTSKYKPILKEGLWSSMDEEVRGSGRSWWWSMDEEVRGSGRWWWWSMDEEVRGRGRWWWWLMDEGEWGREGGRVMMIDGWRSGREEGKYLLMMIDGWMKKWVGGRREHNDDGWIDEEVGRRK